MLENLRCVLRSPGFAHLLVLLPFQLYRRQMYHIRDYKMYFFSVTTESGNTDFDYIFLPQQILKYRKLEK